jgi:hypothetical protein
MESSELDRIDSIRTTGISTQSDATSTPDEVDWSYTFTGSSKDFTKVIVNATGQHKQISLRGDSLKIESDAPQREISAIARYAHVPLHVPAVIFSKALRDPKTKIRLEDQSPTEDTPYQRVVIESDEGPVERMLSVQEWFLDKITLLPHHVVYRIPALTIKNRLVYGVRTMEYSDFRVTSNVSIPMTVTYREPGKTIVRHWTNVQVVHH